VLVQSGAQSGAKSMPLIERTTSTTVGDIFELLHQVGFNMSRVGPGCMTGAISFEKKNNQRGISTISVDFYLHSGASVELSFSACTLHRP
jgi:hypothetical protein